MSAADSSVREGCWENRSEMAVAGVSSPAHQSEGAVELDPEREWHRALCRREVGSLMAEQSQTGLGGADAGACTGGHHGGLLGVRAGAVTVQALAQSLHAFHGGQSVALREATPSEREAAQEGASLLQRAFQIGKRGSHGLSLSGVCRGSATQLR